MSDVRNWLKTLWPVSFKGVPFYFEHDDEQGGRGLVIHELPNRDTPFIEDLGEDARHYSGHAYVHGDAADAAALALIAAMTSRGPGSLVLPAFGPVICWPHKFSRKHEKDKLGFIAFDVKFVREGAATALISIGSLANVAFGAADSLQGIIGASFAQAITLTGRADFVVGSAVEGVETAAATLDAIRSSSSITPDASAAVRDQILAIIGAASLVMTDTTPAGDSDVAALAASVVSATRALADGMAPPIAASAMLTMADAFAPPARIGQAPSAYDAQINAAAAARLARLAALTAFAEAVVRANYVSRPDGITARAQVAARFGDELANCFGAADAGLFVAIQNLRAAVVDFLTRLITNLKPIVTVDTVQQRPSLTLAWRLYADPLRATELVERNQVRHPSFMPVSFEALAA